jgi:hypothetical protein
MTLVTEHEPDWRQRKKAATRDRMRERHDANRLASGWAHMIGMYGSYQAMGEVSPVQAGDGAVVDVLLHFEAGEAMLWVRFVYDREDPLGPGRNGRSGGWRPQRAMSPGSSVVAHAEPWLLGCGQRIHLHDSRQPGAMSTKRL